MADSLAVGLLHRDFGPDYLEPHLRHAGIAYTITVHAASSQADTDAMLARADRHPWNHRLGPAARTVEAARALQRCLHPIAAGEPELWAIRASGGKGSAMRQRSRWSMPHQRNRMLCAHVSTKAHVGPADLLAKDSADSDV